MKILNEASERAKQWRTQNREKYNALQRKWARENREKHQQSNHNSRQKRRMKCLTHYGGDFPECECCGENNIEFLTIDHNGQPIDEKYRSGDNLYGFLIRENFPEGFRVLCMNCNHQIGHYGHCPHKDIKRIKSRDGSLIHDLVIQTLRAVRMSEGEINHKYRDAEREVRIFLRDNV